MDNNQITPNTSADTPYYIAGTTTPVPTEVVTPVVKRVTETPTVASVEESANLIKDFKSIVIYKYDVLSGEVLTGEPVDVDNSYVVPAYHTTKAPLEPQDGYAVCFNQTKQDWEYVPDYRGKTVYSTITGSKITVLSLHAKNVTPLEPAPYSRFDEKTAKWVPDEKQLEDARADMVEKLRLYYESAQDSLLVDVPGIGVVNGGRSSLINVMALINQAAETGATTADFMLANNVPVKVEVSKLKLIRSAIERSGINAYAMKWAIRNKINNAKSVAELQTIEFSIQ